MRFAAFLPIFSLLFLLYVRKYDHICDNIIPLKQLIPYSFISYLQSSDSFSDHKDTTFKSICQAFTHESCNYLKAYFYRLTIIDFILTDNFIVFPNQD